jgi:acetyl esterase/lipase
MDKDFNTRPFFRHLATQGHVVMDVAYRLCPEVDIYGMIGDVKRAVVWMKTNAEKYGLDPRSMASTRRASWWRAVPPADIWHCWRLTLPITPS